MKKLIILVGLIGLVFLSFYTYEQKLSNNKIIKNEKEQNLVSSNAISMLYETEAGSGEYQISTNTSWPQDDYVFNENLSKCENGGTLSWDEKNKRVIMQTNKSDKCYICFDILMTPSFETLKKLGLTVNSDKPNFTKTSCSTSICQENTVGVYKMQDDLGNSYYFRGDVENNYIKFANFYWRIIRINGDGTIRIIYDGTAAHPNGENSADRQIGVSKYNNNLTDHALVGYMYGELNAINYESAHNNKYDSIIKSYIDDWYKDNIQNLGFSKYVADGIYCNDRKVVSGAGYGEVNSTTIYAGNERTGNPSLNCAQENDRFSVNSIIGELNANGKLTYPVGLITLDEIIISGMTNNSGSNLSYTYNGQEYWTMTPQYSISTPMIITMGNFKINGGFIQYEYGVRPVISLKSDIKITGKGTMQEPFEVQ